MLTTLSEKVNSDRQRLEASLGQLVSSRRLILEQSADLANALRELWEAVQEALRAGSERLAFLANLAEAIGAAEDSVVALRKLLPEFTPQAEDASVLASRVQEAEDLLSALHDLQARLAAPVPPFDASRLPPEPSGPTAAGFISLAEARARVRSGRKP
jgi:hypothetical protein